MKKSLLALLFALPILVAPARAEETRTVPDSRSQVQLSFAPVVKALTPSVLNIYTKRVVTKRVVHPFMDDPLFGPMFDQQMNGGPTRQQVERSLGSGLIVDASGLAITNTHVIKDATEIMVVLNDGREFAADVVLSDAPSDIAVLQLKTNGVLLPPAKLQDTDDLQVGDLVLAIGNPFGVGQSVTAGIVSALGRSSFPINDYNFFIQTDAAINPGNSGGPLVAMSGGVVGINTAIFSKDGGSLGIGFAIPTEMVRTVIDAAKSGKKSDIGTVVRNWLGVSTQNVTADIAGTLGLDRPMGVVIRTLHPQSPLAKQGAAVGDIITALNGHAIKDTAELRYRSATIPDGEKMVFSMLRKTDPRTITISSAAAPDTPPRQKTHIDGHNPLSGVNVMNINPAVIMELSLDQTQKGVVITDVDDNALTREFLAPRDVITAINGVEINQVNDLGAALKKIPATGFTLTFVRNGKTTTLGMRQ